MEALVIRVAVLLALAAPLGCAGAGRATAQESAATPVGAGQGADTVGSSALVPAGYGTLRQDDIAIRLQLEGVQVKAIPLDESIIRTLSPDSYRALRELQESRRAQVSSIARRYGSNQYRLWYVSFFAIAPEARFSPMEFIVTNNGRDFRPLDVLPLTAGFGEQRLKVRETQAALYIFGGELDASRPLTVRVETTRNDDWPAVLLRVERERSLIRSRAARQP
jgi:hypothetical protein